MRSDEMDKTNVVKVVEEKKKLSFEEQKVIKRKIQSIERDIERLEEDIKQQDLRLMDPDFYKSDDFVKLNEKYQENKRLLSEKEEEWGELVENEID